MQLSRFALTVFLIGASAVPAAVILDASFEEMVAESHLVLRGRIGQQQSRWDDDGRRIYTYTELQILDVIKGDPAGGSVLIRQPGGVVDGIGQKVAGAARFRTAEEVVLLLQQAPDDGTVLIPLGMAAGKISIDPDGLGGPRAYRDLDGLARYAPGGTQEKPALRMLDREELGGLEAFLARLRKAAQGSAR
jgi:hypothetical protein